MKDRTKEVSVRRIVAWELVSVDSVMESPEEWAFSYSNDEIEASASGMAASDGLLLGRMTYEHLAAYLAQPTGRHADGGLHKQRAQARRFGDEHPATRSKA